MVLSEMIRFLKYDHSTLNRVLSQFKFTLRDGHTALGPKNLVPTPLCITAGGNILASGNLCFRVFKLKLKVINKNFCYLYSV